MERVKENVVLDYISMIKSSWTYNKMTTREQQNIIDLIHEVNTIGMVKGTYNQRWNILQVLYRAYLRGLGYTGANWRD